MATKWPPLTSLGLMKGVVQVGFWRAASPPEKFLYGVLGTRKVLAMPLAATPASLLGRSKREAEDRRRLRGETLPPVQATRS
jgi:hypothetical protein